MQNPQGDQGHHPHTCWYAFKTVYILTSSNNLSWAYASMNHSSGSHYMSQSTCTSLLRIKKQIAKIQFTTETKQNITLKLQWDVPIHKNVEGKKKKKSYLALAFCF